MENALQKKEQNSKEIPVVRSKEVSVHDPSVIKNETKKAGEGNYYVFGSHMAVAKSDDLSAWTQVSEKENDETSTLFGVMKNGETTVASFNDAFRNNVYQGKVTTKYVGSDQETSVDFGTYDAAAWNTARANYTVSGNMWAPDVIYNKKTKEYDMYLSLNGDQWNSVIILLTSKNIEGPYVYQGPVVYTGFSETVPELSYKNTDLELVYGTLDELPEKYNKADNRTWGSYYPHAIDPSVFYDQEGNLRMIYGSWSGGIYELELDENTGLRDYTVQYGEKTGRTENDIVSDPYFGIHIAGGYYCSGEGPYMEYIDGRYYLFLSYGEYAPAGNYQMRVFSSENPDGPFVDTNGVSAIYEEFQVNFNSNYGDSYDGTDMGAKGSTRGARLINNHKWDTMEKGELAQGHNSAITVDGKSYVLFHAKYADGTLAHNLRVHELYTVNDCLLAAPYPYDPEIEDEEFYTEDEVSGNYDVLFNKYDTNKHWVGGKKADLGGSGSLKYPDALTCEQPVGFEFCGDGTIACGEKEIGTWLLSANGKNITIRLTDEYGDENLTGTYEGILIEQNADGEKKTCFTAMNAKTGISIWGTFNGNDEILSIALAEKNMKLDIPSVTYDDLILPTEGLSGTVITWKSSNTKALRSDGTIGNIRQDTDVILTERIAKGHYYYEKTYSVKVAVLGSSDGKVNVDLTSGTSPETLDNPFYQKETLNALYIKYTINWANGAYKTGYDGLLSFYNSQTKGRVSLQSGPYLCYNEFKPEGEVNVWKDLKYGLFDSNPKDAKGATNAEFGKDYTYEIIVTKDSLVMKEDGVEITPAAAGNGTYAGLLEFIRTSCDKFSWGTTTGENSFWATEKCTLKDVVISDTIPVYLDLEKSYEIGSGTAPVVLENSFKNQEAESLEIEYTVNYPDVLDSYGGLFAFYNTQTGGRISEHVMPYLCYNEAGGEKWIDFKTTSDYKDADQDHTFRYVITKNDILLIADGEVLTKGKLNIGNGTGITGYADLLDYVAKCDKFSVGVTGDTCYWGSVRSAVLKDMSISINGSSKITATPKEEQNPEEKAEPEVTVTAEEGLTYDGTEKTLVTGSSSEGTTLLYSLDGVNFTQAVPTGKDAGAYAVYYKVDGGSDYADTERDWVNVEIAKAAHENETLSETIELQSGKQEKKIDLSGVLEEGAVLVSYNVTGGLNGKITAESLKDGEVILSVNEPAEDVTDQVVITVGSQNYENYTVTIPVKVGNRKTEVILENTGVTTVANKVEASELSEYTDEENTEESVEVTLTVSPVAEENLESETAAGIKESVEDTFQGFGESEVKKEYLDISVMKKVGAHDSETVKDIGRVMEIVMTLDLKGKKAPMLIREHEKNITSFERLAKRPKKAEYKDGTFATDGKTKLWIYTRYFSVYTLVYTQEETCQVTLDSGNDSVQEVTVKAGSAMAEPENPVRKGFTFTGWVYKDAGEETAFDFSSPIEKDIVLTAGWKQKTDNSSYYDYSVTPEPVSSPTPSATATPAAKASEAPVGTVAPNVLPGPAAPSELAATQTPAVSATPVPTEKTKPSAEPEETEKASESEEVVSLETSAPAAVVTEKEKAEAEISLNAKLKTVYKGKKVTVTWGKVKNADSYKVYAAYGNDTKYQMIKTVKAGKKRNVTFKTLGGKKINTKKPVKVYVKAFKTVKKNVELAKSIIMYAAGSSNKTYSDAKSIMLTKSSFVLKKGAVANIKAKVNLKNKAKKLLSGYTEKFRYAVTDAKVATVNQNGRITAKGKGVCYVYVYAKNGCAKKIKVQVK